MDESRPNMNSNLHILLFFYCTKKRRKYIGIRVYKLKGKKRSK